MRLINSNQTFDPRCRPDLLALLQEASNPVDPRVIFYGAKVPNMQR